MILKYLRLRTQSRSSTVLPQIIIQINLWPLFVRNKVSAFTWKQEMLCLRRPMLMELMPISEYHTIRDGMELKFMPLLCCLRYLGASRIQAWVQRNWLSDSWALFNRKAEARPYSIGVRWMWRSYSETLSIEPRALQRIMNDNPARQPNLAENIFMAVQNMWTMSIKILFVHYTTAKRQAKQMLPQHQAACEGSSSGKCSVVSRLGDENKILRKQPRWKSNKTSLREWTKMMNLDFVKATSMRKAVSLIVTERKKRIRLFASGWNRFRELIRRSRGKAVRKGKSRVIHEMREGRRRRNVPHLREWFSTIDLTNLPDATLVNASSTIKS